MTRIMGVGPWLDRHVKVWVGALTVVVVGLVIAAVSTSISVAHTAATTAREQAIREAGIQDEYQRCVASIPQLMAISEHVAGVNDLAELLVQNSLATIRAAPKNDPLAATRLANLRRLELAQEKVAAVRSFPTPTRRECQARRARAERQSRGD